MAVLAVAAVIGTAVSIYGNYKASKAEAQAAREQAALNRQKADEILKRNEINKESLFKQAKEFRGKQSAELAGSGFGLGSSAMALIEETSRLAEEEAEAQTRSAEWEARMIRLGASSTELAAGRIERAGKISALGQGITAGTNFASSQQGKG